MARKCERPDCAERATVAYRFDANRRIVFFDHLREGDPQAAGALCHRHADVMVLPRGWFLDDRRVAVPRLFTSNAERVARSPRKRAPSGTSGSSDQLSLVGGQDEADAQETAPDVIIDEPAAWSPDFDQGDDLGGLLSATTPLLSRAFRTNPRSDEEDA